MRFLTNAPLSSGSPLGILLGAFAGVAKLGYTALATAHQAEPVLCLFLERLFCFNTKHE